LRRHYHSELNATKKHFLKLLLLSSVIESVAFFPPEEFLTVFLTLLTQLYCFEEDLSWNAEMHPQYMFKEEK